MPKTMQNLQTTIDINTADVELLSQLPGIGLSKAQAIILYREQYGAFSTTDELKNVKGIGEKLYAKLESRINVH